jgi:hypothetical protein
VNMKATFLWGVPSYNLVHRYKCFEEKST